MKNKSSYFALSLCFIVLGFVLASCGSSINSDAGSGSITFRAVWLDDASQSAPLAPGIYKTAPAGVMTVRILISAPDMAAMQQDFNAAAGAGTMNDVPAGSGRIVTLQGLDASNTVVYQGSSYSISVNPGQTTDCGIITLQPVSLTNPVNGVPSAPQPITLTPGDGQVTISFPSASGATSYNIYWSASAALTAATGTKISNVTSPYIHSGLINGSTYYYLVTAVNSYGESSSGPSYSATPAATPAAPTGTAAAAGDGKITISWNSVNGAAYYYLYWSTSPGVTKNSPNKIQSLGIASFTHTGLTNGTTYYYMVTASPVSSPSIESAASGEVSATPKAGATAPLTAAASSVADTTAVLNGGFDNPPGYTTTAWFEYGPTAAYGSTSGSTAYTQTGNINMTTSLSGLIEHTTYHYRLVTSNSGGTFYGNDMTFATLYVPRTLALGLNAPYRIIVDSSSSDLFFTQYSTPNGTISRVSTGGTVTTVAASLNNPTLLALDSLNVYWVDNNAGGSTTYEIKKALKSGGTPTTLASGITTPSDILVNSTNVYWVENVSSGGAVKKVSINGGPVTVLAAGLSSPSGLAVDSTDVYWTENGQSIKKVGVNGGTIQVLVGLSGGGFISGAIALDQSYVYYSQNMINTGLYKVSINGGSSVAITNNWYSIGILDTSSNIYGYNNAITKIALSDGTSTSLSLLGPPAPPVNGMAVDSTSVYWTDTSSGKIMYVPKN